MSAPPNFTNFTFHCAQGVPSNWTQAHAQSLYDSIIVDPIHHTKNVWTHAHIRWVMKSIWFCLNSPESLVQMCPSCNGSGWRFSGGSAPSFATTAMQASEKVQFAVPPSAGTYQISLANTGWLPVTPCPRTWVDTAPSDAEGDNNDDSCFGTSQPAAIPMDVDPTGPDEANNLCKEERVAEVVQADSVTTQAAATLAGLVAYGVSSDDGSGEEDEEKEKASAEKSKKEKDAAARKEDEITGDADNEREEEEEVDQLDGREVLDSAPKTKGYTCTGWPVHLNQWLRQGKSQPAMHAYMLEMEEDGLLEPMDEKCNCYCGRRQCLLPVKSDNSHPACTKCLISSHGCPNCVAHTTDEPRLPWQQQYQLGMRLGN
ncbi:hypothetical protein EDD85DRAFT_949468 [Armillaria nabsnona]|nr:hypothetical protein EDD85DRAFT_949468 [Armillaria nabsnona]